MGLLHRLTNVRGSRHRAAGRIPAMLLAMWAGSAVAACGPLAWTTRTSMTTARDNLAAAAVGGTVYAVGGSNGANLATLEAYDPVTNTWTTKASMPTARSQLGAAALGGSLYVVGGMNGPTLNTVEVYDPATNSWTTKASMPIPRLGMGLVTVGGTLYCIAGYDGVSWTGTVTAYDPATNSWTALAGSPTARGYVGVAAIGGTIYVFGGNNASYLSTVEAYDIATNSWAAKPSLSSTRAYVAGATMGGTVYAIGGFNGADQATVQAYDPATNAWVAEPSLPAARRAMGVAVVGGTVYTVGGNSGGYSTVNIAGTGCPLPSTNSATLLVTAVPPYLVPVGQSIRITMTVSNAGTANATGLVPALQVTGGGSLLSYVAGPVPANISALSPGSVTAFVWTYSVTGVGSIAFAVSATALDSGLSAPIAASATAIWSIGQLAGNVSFGKVHTAAGTGTAGYVGDNISATVAGVSDPYGVAVDAAGNVYIADYINHRVRKVTVATGIITTVAGTGVGGYNGDNILATSAKLYRPSGVQVTAAGDLFIEDNWNQRIRRVDAVTGIITTVAGNGSPGGASSGIRATSATMNYPSWGALDPRGNLCFTDIANNVIRRVDLVTGLIWTIAGTGSAAYNGEGVAATSAGMSSPAGMVYDAAGNLYYSDYGNQRVRKISVATGQVNTVAGTGTPGYNGDNILATSAQLSSPNGLCLDGAGNLYIADWAGRRMRKVDAVTGNITTVVGNGVAGYNGEGISATAFQFDDPAGLVIDGTSHMYVVDKAGERIHRVDPAALQPPSNLTAVAGYQQVALAWGPPASGGLYALTAYAIWRATCATCAESLTASVYNAAATSYTDAGLINGVWYYYRVASVDTSGAAAFSGTVSGRPVVLPPGTPGSPVVAAGDGQLGFHWIPASAGSFPLTGYQVWRETCAACAATLSGTVYGAGSSWFTDTGLTNGDWYGYEVRAVDVMGLPGPFTVTVTGIPGDYGPPLDCLAWSSMASLPTQRWELGVTAAGGLVYAVGGNNGSDLATNEAYDPVTNAWTTRAPMPTARSRMGAATVGGTVYVAGGWNGARLATLEAYDPATNTWSTKTSMPTARDSVAVAAVGGLVYAIGGSTPVFVSTVEAYNPVTNTWSTKAPMPITQFWGGIAAVGGTLYVVGGNNPAVTTVQAYDPATNSWVSKAPMLTAERDLAAAAIGGSLYAVGGFDYVHAGAVEVYDPATDTWTAKGDMPTYANAFGAATVGSTIYSIGGLGGAYSGPNNEACTPSACPVAPTPTPSTPSSSSLEPPFGKILILPNALNAANPLSIVKFFAHGLAGARVDVSIYSERGMGLGVLPITLDARGLGTAYLVGPKLAGRSLSPGMYYALADGGGVHDKKLFAVVVR